MTKLDPNADANTNYNTMAHILELGINRLMPNKTIKFCKYKHKKSNWISKGVINSIKYRDKLYHKLRKSPIDHPSYIKNKFNPLTYNTILRKIIRQEKYQYYINLFTKFKNDIKNTKRYNK